MLSVTLANRPAILVTAAGIHPHAVDILSNYRLVYADVRASEDELVTQVRALAPAAIMVRYGTISSRVIDAARASLRVISKHGVGIDNIDSRFAESLGIPVLAALQSNSQAVAEHTVCLMMACARRVPWLDRRMREAHWDKEGYDGVELNGGTLGLIGAGAIGMRVAHLAHAIGMKVRIFDPYAQADLLPHFATLDDLDTVLAESSVISLHCPLTDDTRGLLSKDKFERMTRGTIVINTARAGLFEEDDLLRALRDGHIWAGLDCFDQEPLGADSPFLIAPNCVLTPHIGGTTTASFRAMGVMAAENILGVLEP